MTGAGEVPEVAPGRPGEVQGRPCVRCGAVGTHYLTCPGLRLPSGYRFGDDPEPERLVARALARRDELER